MRYAIITALNWKNERTYTVWATNPQPFEPQNRGTYATRAEAQAHIENLTKQDIRNAAHDKAQRITRGAKAQMEWNDYVAYYHDVLNDILAEAIA